MKNKAMIAAISLALVALTGCGKAVSSDPSTSVGPSLPAEKTLADLFDEAVAVSGDQVSTFFAKSGKLTSQTVKATTREMGYADLSGDMGVLFGMERDWGYLNQTYSSTCSLHANNVKICESTEETEKTVNQSTGETAITTINQTSQAFIDDGNFVAIVDDGTGTEGMYAIPNNYKQIIALGTGETFKTYANFALRTDSGIGQRFTYAYYNSTAYDANVEKYFFSEEDGRQVLNYWYLEEYTGDFNGHMQSILGKAYYNADGVVDQFELEIGYYYMGSSVYTSTQSLKFGYATVADFSGEYLDVAHYYDYGYLLPDVGEAGDLDAEFETLLDTTLKAYNGTNDVAYTNPTAYASQDYFFQDGQGQTDDIQYIIEASAVRYSDNIQVVNLTKQVPGDTVTGLIQISNDGENIYTIVKDYDNTAYKVTTAISEENSIESSMDMRDTVVAELSERYAEAIADSETYLVETTAYNDEETGNIVLIAMIAEQQHDNYVGYMTTFELDLKVEKNESGAITSINVVGSYYSIVGSYDWEDLVVSETIYNYGYTALVSSADDNYVPLDPSKFDEKEVTPAMVALKVAR